MHHNRWLYHPRCYNKHRSSLRCYLHLRHLFLRHQQYHAWLDQRDAWSDAGEEGCRTRTVQLAGQHVQRVHAISVAELGQPEVLEGVDGQHLVLGGGGVVGVGYEVESAAQEYEAQADGPGHYGILRVLEDAL